jgi:hypothetical protein
MPLFGPSIDKMKANRDFEGLFRELESDNPKRKQEAVEAIARLNDVCAIEPLIAVLYSEKDNIVHGGIIAALMYISQMDYGENGKDRMLVSLMLEVSTQLDEVRGRPGKHESYIKLLESKKMATDAYVKVVRECAQKKG